MPTATWILDSLRSFSFRRGSYRDLSILFFMDLERIFRLRFYERAKQN
jgi:hypothetical protein